MSDKRPWSVKGILLAALAVAGLSVYAGCGKVGSSDVPAPATTSAIVSLEAIGPRGATTDGSGEMTVRANSRDLLEVIAKVTGLKRTVGFFISANWGTWQGGTLSADDAFTYYPVDGSGTARGILVAGANAGKHDVIARYQDFGAGEYIEARLSITFNLATMSIFPSTIVFNNDTSVQHVVTVLGALPPVNWYVSHPDLMGWHVRDDTSIYLHWNNSLLLGSISSATLPAGGGAVTAVDAEGQSATAVVYMINTACSTGVLTVAPSSGSFTGNTISIGVTDLDLIGANTITVDAKGGLTLDGATTVTLTSAGDDGYFYGDFNAAASSVGSYSINYQDENDAANQCLPSAIVVTYITN